MPKWMQAIDTFTAGKALGIGAIFLGVNPKNLALTIAAATVIAQAGGGQTARRRPRSQSSSSSVR